MIFLYAFLALIFILLIYMRFEAASLRVEHIHFTKNKNCLKILHMSDIHINRMMVSWEKIRLTIKKQKPDFVILTGDYIESPEHINKFIRFLKYIKGSADFYLCFGNHDHRALNYDVDSMESFIKILEASGIHVVNNSTLPFKRNGKLYNVIGIDDLKAGHPDIAKALKEASPRASADIVFSHNPDLVLKLAKGSVDYLFCGHFHGGQIWMPFNLEYKILRSDKLCKMGIQRGLHLVNDINVYINRGLGNVCFPLRFLSPPEITLYYLP